jgi:SAM-dependent methyltransferase
MHLDTAGYFDYYICSACLQKSAYVLGWATSIFSYGLLEVDRDFLSASFYSIIQEDYFIYNELVIFPRLYVDGLYFSNLSKSEYSETYVGFSDNYIIKIEQEPCDQKVNDLAREIDIIRYLNTQGCVSCPQLLSTGRLDSGQRYLIQERIMSARELNYADMAFSIIEQKRLGVSQADFRKQNLIFDAHGICFIIDYDQARVNDSFVDMNIFDYFGLFATYFVTHGYDMAQIACLFHDGSFNLAETTIMKKQVTTHTDMGIYHSIATPDIFIYGIRSLEPRVAVLDLIEFKKGETVLDVGCNMGLLGHYLTDRGCVVTGIDMDFAITRVAKMVANIVRKSIRFYSYDLDTCAISERYDTVCLFSVIHHVKNFSDVAHNIAGCCRRIIIECKLYESGSKFVNGQWTPGSGWQCNSIPELIAYLERHFSGFKFDKYYGVGDRDRHILAFVRS